MRMTIAVMAAGAAGVGLRYAVDSIVDRPAGGIPWATLLVNVVGALLLGVLAAVVTGMADGEAGRALRLVLGIGLLGGFTTFSTYAFEAFQLADGGHQLRALAYVLATNVLGIAAAAGGWSATRAVS